MNSTLYGAGVFLSGLALVGFVGLLAYGVITDRMDEKRRKANGVDEMEWPDYDDYMNDFKKDPVV